MIYEFSWVRALPLQFGLTSLAVSTVLTLFMGGLALGAWATGRRADRTASPLTTYGLIEITLALYALITPVLFPWRCRYSSGSGRRSRTTCGRYQSSDF